MIDVERTDFVTVPTQDLERAKQFYGETLGIAPNPLAHPDYPEFETGNVTISVIHPESMELEFRSNPRRSVKRQCSSDVSGSGSFRYRSSASGLLTARISGAG